MNTAMTEKMPKRSTKRLDYVDYQDLKARSGKFHKQKRGRVDHALMMEPEQATSTEQHGWN